MVEATIDKKNLPLGTKIKTLMDIDFGRVWTTTSPCYQFNNGEYAYDAIDDIGQSQTITYNELVSKYYEVLTD